LTLSDNQKAPPKKMLANYRNPDDHNSATGRRFKLWLPPPFSSKLSRDTAGALYQLAITLEVPVQYFFDGLSERRKKRWTRAA
jgi:hypothetical protein